MSSRDWQGRLLAAAGRGGVVDEEPAQDLVGEPAEERPDGGGLGLAGGHAGFDERPARASAAPLGDRDAVERGVDLAVTAAAEPELLAAGPDRDRRGAVPAGERGLGLEPISASDLAHDLRSGERPATGQLEQRRNQHLHDRGDLTLELVAAHRQIPDALDELARYRCDGAIEACERHSDAVEVAELVERLWRKVELGHELVEVPPQPGLHTCALGNEVLAVVDQQLDLAGFAFEPSDR